MRIKAKKISTVEYDVERSNYPKGVTDEEIVRIDMENFKNIEHDLFNVMEGVFHEISLEIVPDDDYIKMIER